MKLQPVILSGGVGSRLWPLSRGAYPKQLLALLGERTLLQETALRMGGLEAVVGPVASPIVVCNEAHRFIIAEQLCEIDRATPAIILEPAGRNTAPALTLAALHALEGGDDAVMLVMPADHVITDIEAFHGAVGRGLEAARTGAIVTFGITPERPETGYGYIQTVANGEDAVRAVQAFIEKPALEKAESYLAEGGYLWNSGLFMMRASVWLQALGLFDPEMRAHCETAYNESQRDADFVRIGKSAFAEIKADSIDYVVMERLAGQAEAPISVNVVPLDAGWSDVGSWDALWMLAERDAAGNVGHGDVMLEDSCDMLVRSSGRLVACVGVENLVVVETADAVLVVHRSRTQEVRRIVERLQRKNRSEMNTHRKIHCPWGYFDSIDAGDRFQVKRIVVKPGASLSLQMHHHRAEHWIVVRGTAKVVRGEDNFLLAENQSTYIPLGVQHRLENPGKLPLEMIEVQSGSYLGEDDIVRFEDHYGRS